LIVLYVFLVTEGEGRYVWREINTLTDKVSVDRISFMVRSFVVVSRFDL
jgi:hypothetical protein